MVSFLANFQHLDLIAVAVAVAAIGLLGFIVYFSNRRSVTTRTFLWFALATIAYSTVNYLNYNFMGGPAVILWLLRLTLFTAVWHAFLFCRLFYAFPKERVAFPRWCSTVVVPVVIITSLLTLTPLVFSRIDVVAGQGTVTNPVRGPAMPVFGLVVVALIAHGIFSLFRTALRGPDLERRQTRLVLAGALLTFTLILLFNFALPVFLNKLRFIPLAPVFMLPLIAAIAYAIRRYHLLDVKVIATETLTFILAVVTLVEIVFARDLGLLLLRVGMFTLVLAVGVLLIQSVIREVTQRERMQAMAMELKTANIRLTQLDKIKSEFLSFASHQIKAPMTVVKGYASLILDGSYGTVSDPVKEVADKIRVSADRMVGLVNTFLDLRRIQEGKMQYQFEESDLGQLIASVVDEMQQLAVAKKLRLTLQALPHPYRARMDIQRLRQVLQNLVENAVKYTPKGSVVVSLRDGSPETVVLSVADTGRGISAQLVPHLFEQFSRDQSVAKEIAGTGLGLYIAKQIVEAHKGRIWVASAGPDQGSTFSIELPVIH